MNNMNKETKETLEKVHEAFCDTSLSLSESILVIEQFLYSVADGANGIQKNCCDPAEDDVSNAIKLLKTARSKLIKEGF